MPPHDTNVLLVSHRIRKSPTVAPIQRFARDINTERTEIAPRKGGIRPRIQLY